jgi:signal transduction histidine kinase
MYNIIRYYLSGFFYHPERNLLDDDDWFEGHRHWGYTRCGMNFIGEPMSARAARGIAWILVGVYFLLAGTGLFLMALTNTTIGSFPVILFIIAMTAIGIWPVIGARIVSHHPRHPVGWLLFASFPLAAADMFSIGYASYATSFVSGSLPLPGAILTWLNWSAQPFVLVAFTLLNLSFPSGKLLSPRWRIVAWTSAGTLPVYLALLFIKPGPVGLFPGLDNPYAVAAPVWATLAPLYFVLAAIFLLCNLASVISLFVRLRRSRGDERQQVKWLVIPAIIFWISQPFGFLAEYDPSGVSLALGVVLVLVSAPMIVVAVAFAIFKYRLYDLDLIINRTLVYGGLTVAVAGLYALSVGAASVALEEGSQWAGLLLTTGIAAVLYRPLRGALQRGVDRLLGPAPAAYGSAEVGAGPEQPETSHASLPGRWRRMAHAAWVVCAAITWGIFILSIPAYMTTVAEVLHGSLAATGTSSLLYGLNIASFLAYTAAALTSLVLAGVLFLKRPNEGMAVFLSFFLLAYGVVVVGPLASLSSFWPEVGPLTYGVIEPVVFGPLLIVLLSIFPNGRLAPPWTRVLVVVSALYAPVSALLLNPNAYSNPTAIFVIGFLLWFALIFAGLFAQIYRFRHVSDPTERQQTKWVLYGFTLGFLSIFLLTTANLSLNRMLPGSRLLWWAPLYNLGWALTMAVLPISLTFAMMRYRLYEIDILINRTLVYGALTGSVIALYALLVGAFGVLVQSGGNLIVAMVATGLVAVLFQPMRTRLQRGVNRMLYGERDEPFTVLRQLGQSLESSGMPEDILTAIVETVSKALKLPYAEITLRRGERFEHVAGFGDETKERIPFPIQYQDQAIGYLNVALRGPGESLAKADGELLRQIARQAGPVAYTVQLTRDLRQSRARLVTAREEERLRLRRDLHDGLGPVLASQGLKIAAVSHLLDSDRETAKKLLEELGAQNEATVSEIRRLVYALRPPELDELGLVRAVRDYADGLNLSAANGAGFKINVDPPNGELPEMPAAVEVAAYRIATEALTNVTRHAHARQCTVHFNVEANDHVKILRMEIADDGAGLPNDGKVGVGMNSMRERAEEVQGELHVESAPHQGTRVVASFPLSE